MGEGTRKYPFSWALLGDIELGRPNLGASTHLSVYRLMQFTFRDIIEQKYGTRAVEEIFYAAGKLAGSEFYANIIGRPESLNDFVSRAQKALRDLNIGILRIEKSNLEKQEFILTVSEDLDCSGLPDTGHEVCTYDEGFIAALFEGYLSKPFQVKEIDCWCTGDRTCRFDIRIAP
jgi:uncharacterized protein